MGGKGVRHRPGYIVDGLLTGVDILMSSSSGYGNDFTTKRTGFFAFLITSTASSCVA